MKNEYGETMLSIYIRLRWVQRDMDVIKVYASPFFGLDEASILWEKLKPSYMSVSFNAGPEGKFEEFSWKIEGSG